MKAIEARGLHKFYGTTEALRGIDLAVEHSEIFALLGPNGAGKTTAMEILQGSRERDAGTVMVLGTDPATGGTGLRERIGVVRQSSGIYPELTVAEAVRLHAAYYSRPFDPDEVIDMVGLTGQREQRIRLLSGGERRRIDLALGIVGDPEVLFLDELTTGFDPSARDDAWQIIGDLRSLGTTALLTTHDMGEAHVADRVALINGGRIVAVGAPDELGGEGGVTAISFRFPFALDVTELPLDIRDRAELCGELVRVRSAAPTRDLYQLTSWAVRHDAELEGLAVHRPSLEDLYLQLIDSGEDNYV